MDIQSKIEQLYDKDTKAAYDTLQELEAISETEDTLYSYFDEYVSMLKSKKYIMRVRGIRLICKQAQWDKSSKIDTAIDDILAALQDEKPTAVRQVLKYLQYILPYKRNLYGQIRQAVCSIDYTIYKDTMRPLIAKDIKELLQMISFYETT